MRTCPHCGGEIRPSVIRCVHCGTALEPQPQAAVVAGPHHGVPAVAVGSASRALAPAPATDPDPVAATFEAGPEEGDDRPPSDLWVTPADGRRVAGPATAAVQSASTCERHVDGWLIGAALLALVTAVLAVSALSLPWVHGRLSVVGTRRTRAVADITFRAPDSYGGTIAIVIAVTTSVLGLLWFWYGTDRANHLPAFAHPALAVIVGLAGWAAIGASIVGSFSWEHAFIERAPEAGLTPQAMQAILEDGTRPVISLERLVGLQRFGVAATAAVLAGAVAVWSQRPRGSR